MASNRPVPLRTGDGSLTVVHAGLGKPYHSTHGAVNESKHVFLQAGFDAVGKRHVRVLEVGLGTGLNLLLTWIQCLEGDLTVHYTALEPFPLERSDVEDLGHCTELGRPELHEPILNLMTAPENVEHHPDTALTFRRLRTPVEEVGWTDAFDVIYFDAFAPSAAPQLWTTEVFERMCRALIPGGMLVTYCAKGAVRRTMQAAGFEVERMKGPPGKRHMLRAIKPNVATLATTSHQPSI